MKKTFIIHSFGCKVNQGEAEQLTALLTGAGWALAADGAEADLYIVNTCTVTQVADKKARALIRRLRREHPQSLLVVTGCYAQTSPAQIAELGAVDIIAGLGERGRLPELLAGYRRQSSPLTQVADIAQSRVFQPIGPATRQKRARAYLKIEDGCGEFCHYCIIPHARGPVRSLPLAQGVAEAGELLAAGHFELVLSGIHIGAYGQDLGAGENLVALIQSLLALSKDFRLRLGSIEPQQFSPELKELIATEERLCPHLHIPLQAGSDRTLLAMNRHYSTADYRELAAELRSLRPLLAITSDVMVGYPGESEEDFAQSLSFCQELALAKIHVFPYSKRPGTPAAALPAQIPQAEKARRAALLGELAARQEQSFAQSFVGAKLQYLFEQELTLAGQRFYAGHSENYLPLLLPADTTQPTGLLPVSVVSYQEGYLLCRIIGEKDE